MNRRTTQLHIWNPQPHFAFSLYNFDEATIKIKGRLQVRFFLPLGGFRLKILSRFGENLEFGGGERNQVLILNFRIPKCTRQNK